MNIFTQRHRLWRLAVVAGALVVTLFFALGFWSYRTAAHLRDEICRLELGKSSFDEVIRLSSHYRGFVFTHDDLPAKCSPESCTYLMIVEHPLSRLVKIGPRTAFLARVFVSENVVARRELMLERVRDGKVLVVVVGQSSKSDWDGDARIARYSKVETVEVGLPAHDSRTFAQLAHSLDLSCLATVLGCKGPADILPFLKEKLR